jgi:hypothetical protein
VSFFAVGSSPQPETSRTAKPRAAAVKQVEIGRSVFMLKILSWVIE